MIINIIDGEFMRDKFYYIAGGFLLVLLVGFIYKTDGMRIGPAGYGLVSLVSNVGLNDERIDEIYNLKFAPANSRSQTNAAVYIPTYAAFDDPYFYADLFGAFGAPEETDEYLIFETENGRLYIHKYQGLLVFESDLPQEPAAETELPHDNATEILTVFLEQKFLDAEHTETVINFDASIGAYEVRLLNKLAGLNNYSFPVTAWISANGEVLRLEYYTFKYERFADVKLKTMTQVYRELPVDFPDGVEIDLKSVSLVYFFENSIVQPAYLFEGEVVESEMITGSKFAHLIPAADWR